MRELVEAFWNGLFYGVEPEPVEGFEFGGAASVPFSVIGAGRGETAVLGLASPQSVAPARALSKFLRRTRRPSAGCSRTFRASARRCPR